MPMGSAEERQEVAKGAELNKRREKEIRLPWTIKL